MKNFEVIFYDKENGDEPAKNFLETLDIKMKAKFFRTIELLQEYGSDLREPYSKHLDDGIFELRVQLSNNISRVLYFFFDGRKIILTNGFIKKTQKTPPKEITKAKQYREDFLSRFQKKL